MTKITDHELLLDLQARHAAATRGKKTSTVEGAARLLGCHRSTVYRHRAEAGLANDRKRRSDAGNSLLTGADLELVAGVLLTSTNNKGQRMPVATALDMLRANGALPTAVSASTVSRQLYQRRLHPEQLARPTPSQQMASRHPNHLWQVDSTTGAYYYLPGGRLRWMPADEFYKNKVANLVKASSDLLTRYAATDHTSHAFKVRHYLGGETAENLLDFVTWAMWKQDDCPVHGVPLMLLMDPGAANKGLLMRNFCLRAGIRLEHHKPGAARVTGSVEKTHDLVRMHFETRLRFVDPRQVNLDWLNQLVARWAASYCSTARHSRHGATRYAKWMEIGADQLRVAASLDALREAAVKEPETRRVTNNKSVPFNGRHYDLALVPGVVAGLKVTVVQNVFRAPAIDVLFTDADTGAETWHVVEPIKTDEHGFREGAAVWGEGMRTAAYSSVDDARGELTRRAYKTGDGLPTLEEAARARKAHAQAYAGVVDAMADVNATQVPTYLTKRSTPLALPERRVEARRLTHVEALMLIRDKIGGRQYTHQVRLDVMDLWPDGVPEDQILALCHRFSRPADDADALRAAGGL